MWACADSSRAVSFCCLAEWICSCVSGLWKQPPALANWRATLKVRFSATFQSFHAKTYFSDLWFMHNRGGKDGDIVFERRHCDSLGLRHFGSPLQTQFRARSLHFSVAFEWSVCNPATAISVSITANFRLFQSSCDMWIGLWSADCRRKRSSRKGNSFQLSNCNVQIFTMRSKEPLSTGCFSLDGQNVFVGSERFIQQINIESRYLENEDEISRFPIEDCSGKRFRPYWSTGELRGELWTERKDCLLLSVSLLQSALHRSHSNWLHCSGWLSGLLRHDEGHHPSESPVRVHGGRFRSRLRHGIPQQISLHHVPR